MEGDDRPTITMEIEECKVEAGAIRLKDRWEVELEQDLEFYPPITSNTIQIAKFKAFFGVLFHPSEWGDFRKSYNDRWKGTVIWKEMDRALQMEIDRMMISKMIDVAKASGYPLDDLKDEI